MQENKMAIVSYMYHSMLLSCCTCK